MNFGEFFHRGRFCTFCLQQAFAKPKKIWVLSDLFFGNQALLVKTSIPSWTEDLFACLGFKKQKI